MRLHLLARRLLSRIGMEATAGRWIRLTPDNIAALPNADGVFEVANLVRNVQFVGRACGRLRDTLEGFGHTPRTLRSSVGGYFFRFELTTAETEAFQRRIEAYRKRHDGALPPGNRGQVVELTESVRLPPVPSRTGSAAGRLSADNFSSLRCRTVHPSTGGSPVTARGRPARAASSRRSPLQDPLRTDRQIDIHDPGMFFAPDGSFLVVSDTSTVTGGRLIIFHNEPFTIPPFSISSVKPVAQGYQLNWGSAGAVTYNVQRSLNVATLGSFQNIATNLTVRQFTDTSAPAAGAFYRVVATRVTLP